MPWCKKCGYGSPTYKYKTCGHCQSTEIVNSAPWEKNNKRGRKTVTPTKYEPIPVLDMALDPKVEKAIKLEEAVVTEEKKY
jgi:hypothetical protein